MQLFFFSICPPFLWTFFVFYCWLVLRNNSWWQLFQNSPFTLWRFLSSFLSLFLLSSQGLCTVTAAFLHFFFLASFCWVLTEAWQSYLAVIGKMRPRLIRKRFLCLGWGELAHRLITSTVCCRKCCGMNFLRNTPLQGEKIHPELFVSILWV